MHKRIPQVGNKHIEEKINGEEMNIHPTNGNLKKCGEAWIGDGIIGVVDSCKRSEATSA